jgi:hypothetical protein
MGCFLCLRMGKAQARSPASELRCGEGLVSSNQARCDENLFTVESFLRTGHTIRIDAPDFALNLRVHRQTSNDVPLVASFRVAGSWSAPRLLLKMLRQTRRFSVNRRR